jgi:DNA-binding MurR/RpiR family transcriptional regulator
VEELQQLRFAACLKPGDVLIGINYNNSAKNVADAFMTAKKRGASTILITGVKAGVLSRYADHVFHTPARRANNALNISTSTLCQSMVLQLLLLRMWQLAPAVCEQESRRISTYTKLKQYAPSVEKITLSHCEQSKSSPAPEPAAKL